MKRLIGFIITYFIILSTVYAQLPSVKLPTPVATTLVTNTPVANTPVTQVSTATQTKITLKDAKEIKLQATQTIRGLEQLLNFITLADNPPSYITDAITNSYRDSSRNKIFNNSKTTIEDDTDPGAGSGTVSEVTIEKYLNDLDLKYKKTPDPSIGLTILYTSSVKKKDYLYVRVKFQSNFASRSRSNNAKYPVKIREATLRVGRAGSKGWHTYISDVSFYNSANAIESTENDVSVTLDSVSTRIVTRKQLDSLQQEDSLKNDAELKRNDLLYNQYLTEANNYKSNGQYKEALGLYQKAQDLKTFDLTLYQKIQETNRLIAENTFDFLKNKADKAKSEHNYESAIQYYKRAFAQNPQSKLDELEINALSQKINTISLPRNRWQAGELQATIDECETALKNHENEKIEYPELYFFEAEAYKKMAENKNGDSGLDDKALKNYNLAIQYFPNYKDALVARAGFFATHKNDYYRAITDYDVLTVNALDDAPDKPGYYAVKAKWKNMVKNSSGALDDLQTAIELSHKKVSVYYFLKGQLLFNLKRSSESLKSLDTAITLDQKNKDAYFYRGLNYSSLADYDKAGLAFTEVDKLGYDPAQLQAVDSLGNELYLKGQASIASHNFPSADSAFNNALKLKKCYAKAFHGKAEIRLITAGELRSKSGISAAKEDYEDAIDLNKQATKCDPNFSDAYFKQGMAFRVLGKYDLAIKSYGDAIRSDSINIAAYIDRANTFQTQQKYNEALADCHRAVGILTKLKDNAKKANDDDWGKNIVLDLSRVQQLMGQAQFGINNVDSAMTALNTAINLNQNNAEAFYYRGIVNMNKNEFSRAIKDFGAASKISPQTKYFFANGNACLKDKNYTDAISNFNYVMTVDSLNQFKNKNYLRGLSYYKNKMTELALNDYAEYSKLESSKTDGAFYLDYGWAQLTSNLDSAAVINIKLALALSPKSPAVLFTMGCAYAKAGKTDKAFEFIEQSFATRQITKDDIKPGEEAFLDGFLKDKANRTKYNALKETYLSN